MRLPEAKDRPDIKLPFNWREDEPWRHEWRDQIDNEEFVREFNMNLFWFVVGVMVGAAMNIAILSHVMGG